MGFLRRRPFLLFPLGLVAALVTLAGCASAPSPGKALAQDYYNLGNAWFELKKYDQAARAYQTALGWDPSLKIATLNLARSKAETGDTEGALALLAPLAQSDGDNLVVLQYRAWLTARKDGKAAAADLYADLAARLPGDAATLFNAGLCLKAAGKNPEALAALQGWKALDGKGTDGLTALAELLDKAGDPGAADAWFNAADSLPPGDAKRFPLVTARARALERQQLYGDAAQAWAEALGLPATNDPGWGEAQFRRGSLLLLKIEDYPVGSQSLVAAWKANYKDAAAWKALLNDPTLKFAVKLQADLKLAGVTP